MRFIRYRTILCALIALAGLSVSACSDLSRQTPPITSVQVGKILINQQDSDITNRLARVWMRVARQAMQNGDPETAARFFRKASKSAPNSTRPLLGLATARDRHGDVDKAADAYKTVLKINPNHRAARVSLGNLLIAHGKIDEGMGYLMRAVAAKTPKSTDTASNTATSQDGAAHDEDDIFSLISGLFKSAAPSARTPQPAAAPLPKTKRHLTVPASVSPRDLRSSNIPPNAHIERTLNKIKPVSRSQKSELRTGNSKPALRKVALSRSAHTPSLVVAAALPSDRPTTDRALHRPKSASSATRKPRYRIQLAAYRHLENAIHGRQILARNLPKSFPKLGVFVRGQHDGRASRAHYRLRSKDSTSRSRANALCSQALSAGQSCLVIRQTSASWQLVKTKAPSHAAITASLDSVSPRARPAKAQVTDADENPRYRIQLAAYRHLKNAIKGKQILARLLPDGFPGLDILKRDRRSHGSASIKFRIRSSVPWTESHARKFCDSARSTGVSCLLVRHGTKSWRSVSIAKPTHGPYSHAPKRG